MKLARSRRRRNEARRLLAAQKQEPLPLEEQQARAAARAEANRHPLPKYDPFLDVRGDPALRGEPFVLFRPRFRSNWYTLPTLLSRLFRRR